MYSAAAYLEQLACRLQAWALLCFVPCLSPTLHFVTDQLVLSQPIYTGSRHSAVPARLPTHITLAVLLFYTSEETMRDAVAA